MAYDVVVLVEQFVTAWDARQITALHTDAPAPVHYRILLPIEDAAGQVESAVGTLGAPLDDAPGGPDSGDSDTDRLGEEIVDECHRSLTASVQQFIAHGAEATGELATKDPVTSLTEVVQTNNPAEVIILTRPHVVAEIFHLDWTSRARRRLDVPVLHLLSQSEPDWELVEERADAGHPLDTVEAEDAIEAFDEPAEPEPEQRAD